MSNETPQHPHPLFPVYTCVVLQAKAHTVHVFVWSSKGQLLCRKDVSWEPRGQPQVGRGSGLTDKWHSPTVSGQEEQSRDRNQGHPQLSDHQANL